MIRGEWRIEDMRGKILEKICQRTLLEIAKYFLTNSKINSIWKKELKEMMIVTYQQYSGRK